MTTLDNYLNRLPDINTKMVILTSGGLDSSSLVKIFAKKYGAENITSLFIDYGQVSIKEERFCSEQVAKICGVKYVTIDASAFGPLYKGVSCQLDADMPYDGKTFPCVGKALILYGFGASYCYANDIKILAVALNKGDNELGIAIPGHTTSFLNKYAEVTSLYPKTLYFISPFEHVYKGQTIKMIYEMDGNLDFFKYTNTCYTPVNNKSCGVCESCWGRIESFYRVGLEDPLEYNDETYKIKSKINNDYGVGKNQ